MSTFGNITVNGRLTQTQAAANDNDLLRLGEARQLLRSQLAGDWNTITTFTPGQMVVDDNSLWLCQAQSLNQKPQNRNVWSLLLSGGVDGQSAYVYVAYASDVNGTGFSLTPDNGLTCIAILNSTTPIPSPSAGNFAGLWKQFTGPAGADGASAYVYVAYAGDASGTGFSLAPASGLNYIAILSTDSPISSPAAGDFAGLWRNTAGVKGDDGTDGADGTNGTSAYVYVAYASDANGTGFSLAPGSGLSYIAILATTSPIASPTANDFAGRWTKFVGADGDKGDPGDDGAAGAAAYVYIAYASDANGTGFSLTPGTNLNYIAILPATAPIPSPSAGNFAGLWKCYASTLSSVSSPLTLANGALGINAASANTPNYVVQRDANGNFTAGTVTLTAAVIGSATLSYSGGALQINTPVVASTLTVGGLSGILQATAGVISGGATTDNLAEGTANQYFTRARALATPLAGLSSTNVLLVTDTILGAFGKLDNILGGNFPAGTVTGNFTVTGNLSVTGAATLGTLSGVLKAANGVVSGGATSDNVTEGSVNLYFTNARADARITAQRGSANGVAPLDANSKVPLANLYAYGATPYGAASQSAMLNLSAAKQGDFCLRSDQNIVYVLSNNTPSLLSSWAAWLYPVASVNGATGAVVLTTDSIAEGITNLYFTNARADARITAAKGAANGICPLDANSLVPSANLPPVGNSIWIVNSQSTQTNLSSALKGDLANRTDQNQTYILSNNTPSSFASWVPLLYPVASVNGLTGAVTLTTTNVAEGANLYFTSARAIASPLTGFTAGVGTVQATDTILTALQKVAANASGALPATGGTVSGLLNFSGTNNPGLVVNQLSTSQIGSLTTTSANYGNIVYDTTAQQLKALVNGSWTVLSAGANLPLSAGSNYKLTGTLYFNDGLATAIQVGNSWNLRTSNSNQNFDFLNGGTVVLTLDNGNNVKAPNGWYDTGSNTGYKINGQQTLYWSGSSVVLDLGGNWKIGTTSSYAALNLGYGGGYGLQVDQSNDVVICGSLKMNSNRVIDSSNYFYDSSGRRILAGQQSYFTRPNLSGNYSNDYSNINTWMYYIQNLLQNHGLMASS